MAKETRTYSDRRAYLSKATNIRRSRIKVKMVEYLGGRCQVCGYDKYIGSLDFHHVNSKSKSFNLSVDNLYRSWEVIMAELDKCVIVCSNCHRELHAGLIKVDKNFSRKAKLAVL